MTAPCVHWWLLSGIGPAADGVCRKCGATRHFDGGENPQAGVHWMTSPEDAQWYSYRQSSRYRRRGAEPGVFGPALDDNAEREYYAKRTAGW